MHAATTRRRPSVPDWLTDLSVPVPIHISASAYLAADAALAHTASVVVRLTANIACQSAELEELRGELAALGYLPLTH